MTFDYFWTYLFPVHLLRGYGVSFLKRQRLIAIPALTLIYMTVLWFGLPKERRRSMVVTKSTATDTNLVIIEKLSLSHSTRSLPNA